MGPDLRHRSSMPLDMAAPAKEMPRPDTLPSNASFLEALAYAGPLRQARDIAAGDHLPISETSPRGARSSLNGSARVWSDSIPARRSARVANRISPRGITTRRPKRIPRSSPDDGRPRHQRPASWCRAQQLRHAVIIRLRHRDKNTALRRSALHLRRIAPSISQVLGRDRTPLFFFYCFFIVFQGRQAFGCASGEQRDPGVRPAVKCTWCQLDHERFERATSLQQRAAAMLPESHRLDAFVRYKAHTPLAEGRRSGNGPFRADSAKARPFISMSSLTKYDEGLECSGSSPVWLQIPVRVADTRCGRTHE